MERTCSRKMLVHRLYCDRYKRAASRKLSIKTLRSAISLHPHYSIVTIARLRQLFSGRFVATAWRIEGAARVINSCINYRGYLSPSSLDIHHIRDAYIILRENDIFKQCCDFIFRTSGKKKRGRERERVTVINFTKTSDKKEVTQLQQKVNKVR